MATHATSLRRWLFSLPPMDWALHQLREMLIGSLKQGPIPQHIAFVMDGNRRYARTNGLETIDGHNMGFEALARILEVCYKSGVQVVTIYAFSIENFKRSRWEVDALMDMAKTKLVQMSQHGELFERYGASVRILGDMSLVREDVQKEVQRAVDLTRHNDRAVLNVCFPYTSREEISQSIRETVRDFSTVPEEKQGRRPGAGKRPFSESHIQRNVRAQRLSAVEEEEGASVAQQEDQPLRQHENGDAAAGANDDADSSTDLSSTDLDAASSTTTPRYPASSQTSYTSQSPSPDLPPTHPSSNKATSQSSNRFQTLPDPETITSETLTHHMYTATAPPLDLLVRTSGVKRLSDFMLWQCHEATEVKFLDCLWPEFDLWQFLPVLVEWQWRQRQKERWTGRGDTVKVA